jgi:hypothetical protein
MLPKELGELSIKFIDTVASYYGGGKGYPSRFLQVVYQLTVSILKNKSELIEYGRDYLGDDSYDCFHSIAWTNVFKIGTRYDTCCKGAPDDVMIDCLLNNFNTLPNEITLLKPKPNLIIFSTGKPYDKYLKKIFPEMTITDIMDGVAKLENVYDDALVVRTKHFQALSNDEVEELYDYIRAEL